MKKFNDFKGLILIFILVGAIEALGNVKKTDCLHKKNTICQGIMKLQPNIDTKEAYKLSNIFHRVAKKYNLDKRLLISIAFQESGFNLSAVRNVSGLIYDSTLNKFRKMKVGSDFCMMQINSHNIQKMGLSVPKLLSSASYCIEAGAKILAKYQKGFAKKEKTWWTLYNAKTPAKRDIYYNHVVRHYKKLLKKKSRRRRIASK